jgi:hypothetical protein
MTFPNYDVVIKSHAKDYHKLPLVINSLQHLIPQPEGIYIVSSEGYLPTGTEYDEKLIAVKDEDVLPVIDSSRLNHRPKWNWINLVSILQTFTKNDYYLDVQSDNFFIKPIELFDNNSGKPRLFQSTANPGNNKGHDPYFNYSERVLEIEKQSLDCSYIIEFMLYDRRIIRDYILGMYSSIEEFLEISYKHVHDDSYPADQEIFGNMIEQYYPTEYEIVPNTPVHFMGVAGDTQIPVSSIQAYIRTVSLELPEMVACSFHNWT